MESAPFALAFTPTGILASSNFGQASGVSFLRLWDPNSGALQNTLVDHVAPVNIIAVSSTGLITSATVDGGLVILSL